MPRFNFADSSTLVKFKRSDRKQFDQEAIDRKEKQSKRNKPTRNANKRLELLSEAQGVI